MYRQSVIMLSSYNICPLSHSHVKPHTSLHQGANQFYQTIGSPSGCCQITTFYAIIPFYSQYITYIVLVVIVKRTKALPSRVKVSESYSSSDITCAPRTFTTQQLVQTSIL